MFAVFDCSGVPYHSWILENSVCWPSSWQRVSLIPASSVHCIRFTPPTPLGTSVVDGPLLQLRQMLKMSSPNLAPRRWSTSLFRLFLYTLKSEFLLVHVTGPVWTHWPLFYYTVTYHYIRLIVPPPPPLQIKDCQLSCMVNRELTRRVKHCPSSAWARRSLHSDLQHLLKLIKWAHAMTFITITSSTTYTIYTLLVNHTCIIVILQPLLMWCLQYVFLLWGEF